MFINYLVHGVFEFMAIHELALVHELSEFMAVYEQPKSMLMNSWIFMKVSFVVQEYLWTVHELFDERSWTLKVFCSRTFMNYSWMFMNSSWMIISPGQGPSSNYQVAETE